jgi:hypothetical protein
MCVASVRGASSYAGARGRRLHAWYSRLGPARAHAQPEPAALLAAEGASAHIVLDADWRLHPTLCAAAPGWAISLAIICSGCRRARSGRQYPHTMGSLRACICPSDQLHVCLTADLPVSATPQCRAIGPSSPQMSSRSRRAAAAPYLCVRRAVYGPYSYGRHGQQRAQWTHCSSVHALAPARRCGRSCPPRHPSQQGARPLCAWDATGQPGTTHDLCGVLAPNLCCTGSADKRSPAQRLKGAGPSRVGPVRRPRLG